MPPSFPMVATVEFLSDDEQEIISAILLEAALSGFVVSLFDGEEWVAKQTADFALIQTLIGATDETKLRFRDPASLDESGKPSSVGYVVLIHGNGCDVISDYSDGPAMTALLSKAVAVADRLAVADV